MRVEEEPSRDYCRHHWLLIGQGWAAEATCLVCGAERTFAGEGKKGLAAAIKQLWEEKKERGRRRTDVLRNGASTESPDIE